MPLTKLQITTFFFIIGMIISFRSHSQSSNLIIKVENLKKTNGQVQVALYNKADQFLEIPWKSKIVKVNSLEDTQANFKDLESGRYAVSLFHDLNMNNELDKNFMGIPKEGFGFSNNKMGAFGPPSYEDCIVNVDGDTTEIVIRLRHF